MSDFEKKEFKTDGSGRRHNDGERKPFGDRSPRKDGERKPFGDHPPRKGGERKSFGDHPPRKDGERKSFGDRPPRKDGERKHFGDRPPRKDGERKPFGDRPPKTDTREMPSTTSRKVALDILTDVLHKDSYAAFSLDEQLQNVHLSQLDKRFCASIVYRTLENLIRIDYVLSFYLKDAENLEPRVRDILRMSACQMLFHDRIPDNAVVDEAVKLTRQIGLEELTGLTNAVLRNLIREKDRVVWPKPEDGAKYLSIMFSVPLWLAERLMEAYGPEEAKNICAYRGDDHFMVLRPNMNRMTDEEFEALFHKKVWESGKGIVNHAYLVGKVSEIARDNDYLNGSFSIQGQSSILAAQAMNVKKGMQVLDCCAAPGGKTAYMAEIMAPTGRVYAWDVHDHRVNLLRAMARRLRLDNVRAIVRDATVLNEELISSMDAVLLDAPCSGLGVMDNKPDIKYRATPESVAELTGIQEKLLDTCCRYVKKGGCMVYSTCSLLPEENGNQIMRFLEKHPEFEIAPLPEEIPEDFRKFYSPTGLQLLPHRDKVEGFFIARMRRVK